MVEGSFSRNEVMLAVGITTLASYFVMTTPWIGQSIFPNLQCGFIKYNSSVLASPVSQGDAYELSLFLITDLDHDSKVADKKETWHSLSLRATLNIDSDFSKASLKLGETKKLTSNIAAGGRAMELSDLATFDGRLITCDDRTGLLYEVDTQASKVYPWVFLPDGPGVKASKGLKAEWLTVKDYELYVGGLGKEWTTTTGEYVNDHPMWIKKVGVDGSVKHENWKNVFIQARRTIGVEYPGYAIHEAVQWNDDAKRWFFLPRRASNETYSEEADEFRGTNFLISCNANFQDWKAVEIGTKGDGARGFSAFQIFPKSKGKVIIALKSEEKDGKPVASYLSVFDVDGHVILPDTQLEGAHKYEGLAFA